MVVGNCILIENVVVCTIIIALVIKVDLMNQIAKIMAQEEAWIFSACDVIKEEAADANGWHWHQKQEQSMHIHHPSSMCQNQQRTMTAKE